RSHRSPPLFPYPTLFRSAEAARLGVLVGRGGLEQGRQAFGVDALTVVADPRRQDHRAFLIGVRPQKGLDDAVAGVFQGVADQVRSEEHTSELQSRENLVY